MVPALQVDGSPAAKKQRREVPHIVKRVSAVARPGRRRSSIEPQEIKEDKVELEGAVSSQTLPTPGPAGAKQSAPTAPPVTVADAPVPEAPPTGRTLKIVKAKKAPAPPAELDGCWIREQGCRVLVIHNSRLYWPDGTVSQLAVDQRTCVLTYEGVTYSGKAVDAGARLHWDDGEIWHRVAGDQHEASQLVSDPLLTPMPYTPCSGASELLSGSEAEDVGEVEAPACPAVPDVAPATPPAPARSSDKASTQWADLVEWLGMLARKYAVRTETFVLTTDVLARFLRGGLVEMASSFVSLPFSEKYVMGASALRIAAKFVESRDLSELSEDVENRGICPWLLEDAEACLLNTLHFRVHRPTAWHELHALHSTDALQWALAEYLLELSSRCFQAVRAEGTCSVAALLTMRRLLRWPQPEAGLAVTQGVKAASAALLDLLVSLPERDAVALRHADSARLVRQLAAGIGKL